MRQTSLLKLQKLEEIKKEELEKTRKVKTLVENLDKKFKCRFVRITLVSLTQADRHILEQRRSIMSIQKKYTKKRNSDAARKIQIAWKKYYLKKILK